MNQSSVWNVYAYYKGDLLKSTLTAYYQNIRSQNLIIDKSNNILLRN